MPDFVIRAVSVYVDDAEEASRFSRVLKQNINTTNIQSEYFNIVRLHLLGRCRGASLKGVGRWPT